MITPSSSSYGAARGSSMARRAELDAAFGEEDHAFASRAADGPPGYDATESREASQNGNATSDVFFDAGDAMGEEPTRPTPSQNSVHDPLGASGGDNDDGEDSLDDATAHLNSSRSQRPANLSRTISGTSQRGYDFERPSHFGANRSRSSSTAINASNATSASPYGAGGDASTSRTALNSSAPSSSSFQASSDASGMARARLYLGRFGRFVGMRVPGAAYSSLAQAEANGEQNPRRRVMGGGLGQDGVFANLNAKPETRRRRANNGGSEDRGEDDDLADDVLPPTYEIAAADAAPGYWETTIAPGGLGWTPGGGNVGDLEDLILEGLPIGNVFGFAWNLLVSVCFQFVGFLLTYLLHTTHAARCGSRAGLGITLLQYGFYLRTRALQLEEGNDGNTGGSGSGNGNNNGADPSPSTDWFGNSRAINAGNAANATASADGETVTAFGSNGGNTSGELNTDTSEWLAYALMIIGWLILLSSVLSYFRIHRWGRALIAASRREQESTRAAENGGQAPEATEESNAPIGFIHRLRTVMGPPAYRNAGRSTGTGEDWVIYPGAAAGAGSAGPASATSPRPVTAAGGVSTSIWGAPPRAGTLAYPAVGMDEEQEDGAEEEEGEHLSPEEQRLMSNMRRAGLL
ncbi:hypothetical protein BCV69DRAFT_8950 [Microstroma glucosiphilum]|uniref:Uncharacterized protein n=1 Tax=Pseudomicrostroma glucosiphilum TaxID=1684307 RepID=A0A316UHD5_9BASI|nr:hypothetical protein BCV69DRAFT_8950 [Pseudomicrostroma glucosiphilum]PWN23751.1 hypothetical protein BCV69DRAFT_8950 [Pseudomicrostroma glucosiphilum]